MKGKENYLQKNGKQFRKICETLQKYEVPSFKNSFIIDTIAIFRTQSQLGWFLCYNNKQFTMFCWHGTLSLMFGSLH